MSSRKLYVFFITLLTLLTLSLSLAPDIFSDGEFIKPIYTFKIFDSQLNITKVLIFKVSLIFIIVFLTYQVQNRSVYRPFVRHEQLRSESFDAVFKPYLEQIKNEGIKDLRFNVMKKRTYLKLGNFLRIQKLLPIYHFGFEQNHLDRCLNFWIVVLPFFNKIQGVCGLSLYEETAKLADLRKANPSVFRLSKHKLKLTENLKFILSIPLIQWQDNKYSIRGVMNIDTNDTETADLLFSDNDKVHLKKITEYFENYADYISKWL